MSRVGWIRIAVIAIAVGLLEFCCRVGLIDHRVVIPPSEMADALVRLLISGQANDQIVRTFGIVVLAVLISVVAGFALGGVIHALPRVRQALDPFFATYYAVPIFIFSTASAVNGTMAARLARQAPSRLLRQARGDRDKVMALLLHVGIGHGMTSRLPGFSPAV